PIANNYHLRARDYSELTGQFTGVDPRVQTSATSAASPYAFGSNNPLTNTDPSGLGCGWFSGLCDAATSVVSTVTNTVSDVVNTVSDAVTTVVNTGAQLISDTVSDLKTAATNVINTAT